MRHYLLSFIMIIPATVLAIDCTKTTSEAEKTICNNLSIQRLDAILNKAYQDKIKVVDKKALKDKQISWLKEREKCSNDVFCLSDKYISRIAELTNLKNISIINNSSKDFDFLLTASNCKQEDKGTSCEGDALLNIFQKNKPNLIQSLPIEKVTIGFNQLYLDKKIFTTTPEDTEFSLKDINFDGREDVILHKDNEGGYMSPTYHVYLYNPSKDKFFNSRELTELLSDSYGDFDIDGKSKTITTNGKDGYAWRQKSTWKIEKNKPVLVKQITEEDEKNGENTIVTIKEMVNGKWKESTTKKKIEQ
ncbi:lysozyme inhibitor LprI family protein [Arsenophonus sp.]|uniref:lysozyme inhibitor LprI family protein n=1 Tax=Arsenophonus sp. TaxID=1872640 RepID=UPI0038794F71